MAFDFPNTPTEGQEFAAPNSVVYVYKAPIWVVKGLNQGMWVQMTQAAYDALAVKDPNVLYVVIG